MQSLAGMEDFYDIKRDPSRPGHGVRRAITGAIQADTALRLLADVSDGGRCPGAARSNVIIKRLPFAVRIIRWLRQKWTCAERGGDALPY